MKDLYEEAMDADEDKQRQFKELLDVAYAGSLIWEGVDVALATLPSPLPTFLADIVLFLPHHPTLTTSRRHFASSFGVGHISDVHRSTIKEIIEDGEKCCLLFSLAQHGRYYWLFIDLQCLYDSAVSYAIDRPEEDTMSVPARLSFLDGRASHNIDSFYRKLLFLNNRFFLTTVAMKVFVSKLNADEREELHSHITNLKDTIGVTSNTTWEVGKRGVSFHSAQTLVFNAV